jgi:hypothetical protein
LPYLNNRVEELSPEQIGELSNNLFEILSWDSIFQIDIFTR